MVYSLDLKQTQFNLSGGLKFMHPSKGEIIRFSRETAADVHASVYPELVRFAEQLPMFVQGRRGYAKCERRDLTKDFGIEKNGPTPSLFESVAVQRKGAFVKRFGIFREVPHHVIPKLDQQIGNKTSDDYDRVGLAVATHRNNGSQLLHIDELLPDGALKSYRRIVIRCNSRSTSELVDNINEVLGVTYDLNDHLGVVAFFKSIVYSLFGKDAEVAEYTLQATNSFVGAFRTFFNPILNQSDDLTLDTLPWDYLANPTNFYDDRFKIGIELSHPKIGDKIFDGPIEVSLRFYFNANGERFISISINSEGGEEAIDLSYCPELVQMVAAIQ